MTSEIERASIRAGTITNTHISSNANIERSKFVQRPLAEFPVSFLTMRVHDAYQTNLPGTSASDDLGLTGGTFGSAGPQLRTYDVKTLSTMLYCRTIIVLPETYEAAEDCQIRIHAGMLTTVAGTSATVDVQTVQIFDDNTVSSDLTTTSPISINSLTLADHDFLIDPTNLVPGSLLDCRFVIAVTDPASATAVIGVITNVMLRCDIRP